MNNGVNKIRLLIFILIPLAIIIILFFPFHGKETKRQYRVPPINLTLSCIADGSHDGALFVLRLFNREARQVSMDNAIFGEKDELPSVRIGVTRNTWSGPVSFYIANEDRKISSNYIQLLKYPGVKEIIMDERHIYEAIYRVMPDADIKAGDNVYARMDIRDYHAKSNLTKFPGMPETEIDILKQKARVSMALGDYPGMMKHAERIIAIEPGIPDGYWYSGLALEAEKDYSSALEMYESALERSATDYEKPVILLRKIKELRGRLHGQVL